MSVCLCVSDDENLFNSILQGVILIKDVRTKHFGWWCKPQLSLLIARTLCIVITRLSKVFVEAGWMGKSSHFTCINELLGQSRPISALKSEAHCVITSNLFHISINQSVNHDRPTHKVHEIEPEKNFTSKFILTELNLILFGIEWASNAFFLTAEKVKVYGCMMLLKSRLLKPMWLTCTWGTNC